MAVAPVSLSMSTKLMFSGTSNRWSAAAGERALHEREPDR